MTTSIKSIQNKKIWDLATPSPKKYALSSVKFSLFLYQGIKKKSFIILIYSSSALGSVLIFKFDIIMIDCNKIVAIIKQYKK